MNADIKDAIKKLEKSILEDGKVDRAEAQILLAFSKTRAADNAEMAEFVKALEDVLEDGIVTPEESLRIGAHLKWLTREAESEEPETSFLGRLFKLKRNRTTVRTEVVAGVTTFMTMAYILAVNPSILSKAGMPAGGVFLATAVAARLVERLGGTVVKMIFPIELEGFGARDGLLKNYDIASLVRYQGR